MLLLPWLRTLQAGLRNRLTVRPARPRRTPPRFESLETRCLLAADGDGTLDTATTVLNFGNMESFDGDIEDDTDVDLFAVELEAGESLTIDVDASSLGSNLNSLLRIFGDDGLELAVNDDQVRGNFDSYLTFVAPFSGVFFVGVSSSDNFDYDPVSGDTLRSGSTTGDYTLFFERIAADPDSLGGTLATASPVLTAGTSETINSLIDRPSDVDMFVVTLAAGDVFTADIDAEVDGSPLDSVLRLFDSNGDEVAFNDDDDGGTLDSRLVFVATTAGQYYLGVSGFGNSTYEAVSGTGLGNGVTGEYTLRLTREEAAAPVDDANTLLDDTFLTVGYDAIAQVVGTIDPASDIDFYSVLLAAGDRLTIDLRTSGGTLNGAVRVFDLSGTELAGSPDFDPFLEFEALITAVFYIGISAAGNTGYNPRTGAGVDGDSTGDYQLVLTREMADDGLSGVNLRPFALTLETGPVVWGDTTRLRYTVQNVGDEDAGPFDVQFVVQPAEFSGAELLLATVRITGLAANSAQSGTVEFTLPGTPFSPPARFSLGRPVRFLMRVDPFNEVDEFDDTDNDNQGEGIDEVTRASVKAIVDPGPNTLDTAVALTEETLLVGGTGTPGSRWFFFVLNDTATDFRLSLTTEGSSTSSASLRDRDGNLLLTAGKSLDGQQATLRANLASNVYHVRLDGLPADWELRVSYEVASSPVDRLAFLGGSRRGLLSADLNGDGFPDLIGASQDGLVTVLKGLGNGSFGMPELYVVGYGPTLKLVDINGDGRLDILSANADSDSVSVLQGVGDGAFMLAEDYPVDSGPRAIQVGDLNGDGLLDIVTSSYVGVTGSVSVLLGTGSGRFAIERRFLVGQVPSALQLIDLDDDGNLDIVTTNEGSRDVSVLLGRGDGTFENDARFEVSRNPRQFVAADLNGDGIPDIVVANRYDGLGVLLGRGDGTFNEQVLYEAGNFPRYLQVVDLNGDGVLDLATANFFSSDVSVLLGRGDGTFAFEQHYATGSFAVSLEARDLNRDGVADLIVGTPGSADVSILMGRGDGTFNTAVRYPVGITENAPQLLDVNADGHLDLVAVDRDSLATILFGRGDGTFAAASRDSVGINPRDPLAVDLNGDGILDLVVANGNSAIISEQFDISVLLGRGDGTFSAEIRIPVRLPPVSVQVGDLNRDGRPDLVAGGTILFGRGDGNFVEGPPVATGSSVVLTDINKDGLSDLIVTSSNSVSVFLGRIDGIFDSEISRAVGTGPIALQVVDLNRDGWLDLITANDLSNDLSVLLSRGDGTFAPQIRYEAGTRPRDVQVADVNGDGNLDIVAVNYTSNDATILLGNGDGSFLNTGDKLIGSQPRMLRLQDVDGDQLPDIVAVLSSGVSVGLSDGDGSFFVTGFFGSGQLSRDIQIADVDGDGAVDLLVANAVSRNVSILFGSGDGRFAAEALYPVGFFPNRILVADFNGDGFQDFVTSNYSTNDLTIMLGDGEGTFAPRPALESLGPRPIVADLNGDGQLDYVMLNRQGDLLVRMGRGGGELAPAVVLPNSGQPFVDLALVRGTVAGLPTSHLAALHRAGGIDFYSGDSSGMLRLNPALSLSFSTSDARLVAGDLNADGLDELLLAQSHTLQVFSLGSTGEYTVRSETEVGFGAFSVAVADIDQIGGMDVVLTEVESSSVSLLLNLGGFQFDVSRHQAVQLPYGQQAGFVESVVIAFDHVSGVVTGDFNEDGRTDVATLNVDARTAVILFGASTGGLVSAALGTTLTLGATPKSLVSGDFNRDGHRDIAVLLADAQTIAVFLGVGQGNFSRSANGGQPLAVGPGTVSLVAQDVTGSLNTPDGILDLLVGNAFGDVLVLAGRGDGSFAPLVRADRDVPLVVADLDGDGKEDIIVANRALDRVSLVTNVELTGANAASGASVAAGQTQTQTQGIFGPGAVKLVNLNDDNGDGAINAGDIADLVVANSGGNTILVYQGLGQGQFSAPVTYFAGSSPAGLTLADVNADGRPDIVIANQGSNDVSILLNQPAATAAAMSTFTPGPRLNTGVGSGPVSTTVMDLTGDGVQDLIVTNAQSGTVSLLTGVGGGFFNDVNPAFLSIGNTGGQGAVIVPASDPTGGSGSGAMSLVATNPQTGQVVMVSNLQQAFFSDNPNQFIQRFDTGGLAPIGLAVTDFNRDGRFDLIIANSGSGSVTLLAGTNIGFDLFRELRSDTLQNPNSLVLSADGLDLYCTDEGEEVVTVFDLRKLLAEGGVPIPGVNNGGNGDGGPGSNDSGSSTDGGNSTTTTASNSTSTAAQLRQSLLAGVISNAFALSITSLLAQLGLGQLSAVTRGDGQFNLAAEFLDFGGSGSSLFANLREIVQSNVNAEELYSAVLVEAATATIRSVSDLVGVRLSDSAVASATSFVTPLLRKYVQLSDSTPKQLFKVGLGVLRAIQKAQAADASRDAGESLKAEPATSPMTNAGQALLNKVGPKSTAKKALVAAKSTAVPVASPRPLRNNSPRKTAAHPVRNTQSRPARPTANTEPTPPRPVTTYPQQELDRLMTLLATDPVVYESVFTSAERQRSKDLAP